MIYILDAHACMIYVHELKIKLLKSKFECCPVFQMYQILLPWNSDEFTFPLAKRVAELVSPLLFTNAEVARIPLTLISPLCAWKSKTYRRNFMGSSEINLYTDLFEIGLVFETLGF